MFDDGGSGDLLPLERKMCLRLASAWYMCYECIMYVCVSCYILITACISKSCNAIRRKAICSYCGSLILVRVNFVAPCNSKTQLPWLGTDLRDCNVNSFEVTEDKKTKEQNMMVVLSLACLVLGLRLNSQAVLWFFCSSRFEYSLLSSTTVVHAEDVSCFCSGGLSACLCAASLRRSSGDRGFG